MDKAKILIVDKIDTKGIELLESEPNFEVDIKMGLEREKLLNIIENYDGLIIRSDTNIDIELMNMAKKLKVVGRAGNGVDNIDIPEATKRGIIVANTPDSNTISACELTIGLLLAQSRNIAKTDRFLKEGNWDRDSFMGTELFNKTLGIIGLGRIGSLVATRMNAFDMKVIAYDPYISDERFKRFNVEKKDTLEDLLKEADFITIHTPRTEETINIISEKELELMKDGVRIVNAARGKLISEKALCKGLKKGKIASVGIDVHEHEPRYSADLYEYENVVVTPHIGATTIEAQQNVGVTIAKQVINGIKGDIVPNAVNLPTIHRDELKEIKPYIDLAEKLGKIYYQLNKCAIKLVDITYWGDIGCQDTEMVTVAFIKGLLEPVMADKINYINAMIKAEEGGIGVNSKKICNHHNNYSNLITIKITNNTGDTFTLSGTISNRNEGKLVEIMEYEVDIKPTECMVFLQNYDVPGVIGHVGTFLGTNGVNVATMQVGRKLKGDKALMLLNVDDKVTQDTLLGLQKHDDILWAKFVQL